MLEFFGNKYFCGKMGEINEWVYLGIRGTARFMPTHKTSLLSINTTF